MTEENGLAVTEKIGSEVDADFFEVESDSPVSCGWVHPTGNRPKSVTLIGLGPSREDYTSVCLEQDVNPAIKTDEVWTVNRGGLCIRHDLLFVMDHLWGEAKANPGYGEKLWRHNKPIITSDDFGGWPNHVHGYPFAEIESFVKNLGAVHYDWFHNSIPYILCYAAFIGVKEMFVWGCDYHHHMSGRVESGHPNAAYWVGVLERTGLVVKTTGASTFLGANQRNYIYGYLDDPRDTATKRLNRFMELISG